MKRNLVLLASLTILPLATPQASDPPIIRAGTYTVCDDSRDPSDSQSIHMKVGDKVRIGPIGAAAEVQFEQRVVSMVASAEGRELSSVVEFAHEQNGRVQMMKHLVRIVPDTGYSGTGCTLGNVNGACHLGDTHVQN